MPGADNIVLVGMRASGKTTVGRALADHLSRPFVDLDDELGRRARMDPDEVLSQQGEARFRELEREVLVWAAGLAGHVIATGGGAVLDGAAFAPLADSGTVVYLEQPLEVLVQRCRDRPRPPLTELPLADEIRSLLARRDPIYRSVADITIRPEGPNPILGLVDRLPIDPEEGARGDRPCG